MLKKRFFGTLLLISFITFGQDKNGKLEKLLKVVDSLSIRLETEDSLASYKELGNQILSPTASLKRNTTNYKTGLQNLELSTNTDATQNLKKSRILSLLLENDSLYSQALYEVGLVSPKSLRFDDAVDYFEEALEVTQNKVDNPKLEAIILKELAAMYIENNNIGNSFKFANKALRKSQQTKDYVLQASILNLISIGQEQKEDLKQALFYRKLALELYKKNHSIVPLELLIDVGNNFLRLKKLDSATIYFQKAKQSGIEKNYEYGLGVLNFNLGETYQELSNLNKSIEYFKRSYEYFKEIRDEKMLGATSKNISELYSNLGRPTQALTYLKEYLQWMDSLQKKSSDKKLEEFQIKYELIEKKREIEILDHQKFIKQSALENERRQKKTLWIVFSTLITLITIATWIWLSNYRKRLLRRQKTIRISSVLKAELKERKRIARDLHDSVGQSISAVKIRASSLKISSESEKLKHKKLLEQIDYVYDELRYISHNILPITLSTLGLVPAVRELISDINTEGSLKVQLNSASDFSDLSDYQSINLFRIIQETLVNITKHAKATLVDINLFKKDGSTCIYIMDNGIGMDISKIYSSDGMGWRNIISRVKLLSGEFDVKSSINNGTSIAIELKSGLST